MSNTDWMPRRREDQLAMARTWIAVLPSLQHLLGVTDAEISELEDLAEDAEKAQIEWQKNPGDRVLAARAREAFGRMVTYMRTLRRRRFFNTPLQPSQWLSLNLEPPDTTRTDHIHVSEEVDFVLEIEGTRQVHIRFWQRGMAHMAKPTGYDGAVVDWGVFDEPPDGPHEMTGHEMASRTPHTLRFPEEERGKTVYVTLRWQNERGFTGPWSDMKSTIIP